MSTHKHIDLICVAVLVCTVLLTLLFMNGERFGLTPVVDWDSENSSDSAWFTRYDRTGDWDSAGATRIVLAGDRASIHGGGAYTYDGDVVIAQAGRYVLSGALTDGSVVVSAENSSKVWILLDGAEISCSDDACIRVDQADKVFLTLAAGSENSLAGGEEYGEAAVADKRGGVIFSHDDLTVNGGGSLRVSAGCGHGFDVNDELVITGGAISIDAPEDGLHVNDGLRIENAEITVRAGDEGICLRGPDALLVISSGDFDIQSGGAGIKCAGDLLVEGGTFRVTSGTDAVQCEGGVVIAEGSLTLNAEDEGIRLPGADTLLTVRSGDFDIQSGGAGIKCAGDLFIEGGTFRVTSGKDAVQCEGGAEIAAGSLTLNAGDEGIRLLSADTLLTVRSGELNIQSAGAGIKCEGDLLIEGGTLDIGSGGDAIHCAGTAGIRDGALSLRAGDDGIHADKAVGVHGGRLAISECYEGVEARTIDITGGEIEIYPTDDGLNANGGSFIFGFPGMPVRQEESAEDTECWIRISGGSLTVINKSARDADGIDSNGDILISGGVIRISLNAGGTNNAIDYGSESGGVLEISGGEVVACGSSVMAEGFSESSAQCAILYNLENAVPADTTVRLLDAGGREILSYTAPCSFSSAAISSPEMKLGESFTLLVGDREEAITLEEISGSYGDRRGGNMNWSRLRGPGGEPGGQDFPDAPAPPGAEGETPDFADMGLPPDTDGERPDRADMPEAPDMSEKRAERAEEPETPEPAETAEPAPTPDAAAAIGGTARTGPQPVSAAAWIMVGACLFVLIMGILFAVKYRV